MELLVLMGDFHLSCVLVSYSNIWILQNSLCIYLQCFCKIGKDTLKKPQTTEGHKSYVNWGRLFAFPQNKFKYSRSVVILDLNIFISISRPSGGIRNCWMQGLERGLCFPACISPASQVNWDSCGTALSQIWWRAAVRPGTYSAAASCHPFWQ